MEETGDEITHQARMTGSTAGSTRERVSLRGTGHAGLAGQRTISAQHVHAAVGKVSLPSPLARMVLCVLGLSNYAPYTRGLRQAI
jgi:hypothetical protein